MTMIELPMAAQDDLCVARVPLFQGLTHEEQVEVAQVARPTRVDKDDQVYAPGSDVSQLMVVHTGRVKISRVSPDGHEQIVRVLGPGDFAGESAFISGARPDHFATAMETGSMCVFRHADLDRLLREHPSVGLRLLQGVSRRLDETEARLASVISGDVSSRLAAYLVSLPARHTGDGPTVTLPLAKKDIASLLDTTPESLSRQLRRLTDTGVIAQRPGGRVTITDLDALLELAGED
ncbi:Crp/Fnr family transcriptional regulator [Ornithinimicrobium avium]|uniref:Crp/Fnr family transcriptional regulator n=1 Tax=Ornithinimicrobium avium TaxID=2283195 RepID=A0A345NJH5_9MICO|nr:Crp/Fnr family transcriptional regulator [Ornithinimicrobium avium]AXH95183.1 Crp/Fnr family transcriptional regulator [Ornithinimicrobium avium]